MAKPPESLVEHFTWARHGLAWCQENAKSKLLLECMDLTVSSWFSGIGSAEVALSMISEARKGIGGTGSAFQAAYQFEINSRARAISAMNLPYCTCQHVDILRLLSAENRNELAKIDRDMTDREGPTWDCLLNAKLDDAGLCSRHLMRFGGQTETVHCFSPKTVGYF